MNYEFKRLKYFKYSKYLKYFSANLINKNIVSAANNEIRQIRFLW